MKYAFTRIKAAEAELEPVTEVNIIPVIDISLVLLVILFVTAPLLSYPNLPIEMPKAKGEEDRGKAVYVSYTADGKLAVGSRDADWAGLGSLLRSELEKSPGAPVVLRIDKAVPYRTVQKLIAQAKTAGAAQIAIGTEPPK